MPRLCRHARPCACPVCTAGWVCAAADAHDAVAATPATRTRRLRHVPRVPARFPAQAHAAGGRALAGAGDVHCREGLRGAGLSTPDSPPRQAAARVPRPPPRAAPAAASAPVTVQDPSCEWNRAVSPFCHRVARGQAVEGCECPSGPWDASHEGLTESQGGRGDGQATGPAKTSSRR